ncbi:N-acetylgalactosaminyltransferase 6-like isoform X1 [Anopheles funestus]|uniref:N-acetylgalactosaminyltransferase 6-like isoform X1 n=1 Tax=Anopheles funestus TaxID=62324 RepID=UPI0020C68177|nr:N-acetylgalactosaminyltransferase 6-like isoform X1 [Anopheles funestus]
MDDKLRKARKARIRSIVRSAVNFLYPLRYLVLIGITVIVVLLLRQRDRQILNIGIGHFGEHFVDVTRKSRVIEKIDYHNYEQIQNDLNRVGPGEQGKPATLSPEENDSEKRKELYYKNGFNALLSDKISINRSIADLRHPRCHRINYSNNLPQTSIIVPFYDEHWTTLLRTVYSIVRRTPPTLLKEIILVDDGSLKHFLKQPLDDYIARNLKHLVRVIHLPERNGLITARLSGANVATGEVLLFLDSHVEVGINWLPPLLEPIARNYRTCVCPFIDVIKDDTFAFVAQDEGARGAFDWNMLYKRLPLRPEDQKDPTDPFPSPVMAGGLFAISAKFFWELGGYDEQLEIWGAEQYELSFKIWMCGGRMLDTPCSRVGHIYRSYSPFPSARTYDYVAKNHKRVAEVWMDEYKRYVYAKDPTRYSIDAGDLSKMKQLRKTLNCKPFRWFMNEVAPDLIDHYPPIEPEDFASGAVQNEAFVNLCVEESDSTVEKRIVLSLCVNNKTIPERSEQHFRFTWRRDIKAVRSSNCVDISNHFVGAELQLYHCHNLQGNQMFRYDVDTKQIFVGKDNTYCFEADGKNRKLFLNRCSRTAESQRWRIGQMNVERLRNWTKYGAKFKD